MKFITTTNVKLEDKKLGLVINMLPPTNSARFTLYDLGSDESLASKVTAAEFVYNNCVETIKVKGREVSIEDMIRADLSDEKTAEVYFGGVNLVVSQILGLDVDEEEVKK